MSSKIHRVTFIVRLARDPNGHVTGVVERVRTGEKAPVAAVEDVGVIVAEMLAREEAEEPPPATASGHR
ncbi:MAG: hypothetical protein ACRDHY_00430 [Anaerolineales bacterium]